MRRVVITGMGVVSPVGCTLEDYWQSLIQGRCGVDHITRYDCTGEKVTVAAEVKGDFNPLLYFKKPELRRLDLFTQYAVAAAQQAMDDSGLMGAIDPERLGVYVGSGIGGITTIVDQCYKMYEEGSRHISPYLISMMIGNIATGNIAIRFQAQGPSLPVTTACATSTNAIGEAFRAVRDGYADAILAGGSEATVCKIAVAGFANCMALSTNPDPTTACVPFDKRRDGFVMGEGAGVLVLEEYEHAKARGAKIYGEVAGYGNTCDAHHVTAPDPEAKGAARSICQAMKEAGLTGSEQMYINAHGTSTELNDRSETLAYKMALGENAHKVAISSTKSMTGHMLGAAGAVEAIACMMALTTGILPPTIGLEEPDPNCDLDYIPGKARKQQVEAALSSSFGFGGHNACVAFKAVREGEVK